MGATKDEIYQAKTLQQLEALAKRHGYSFGWARRVHDARIRKEDRSESSKVAEKEQVQAKEEGAGGDIGQMDIFTRRSSTDYRIQKTKASPQG